MENMRKSRATLDSQIERLRQSLEKRSSLPFDPIMMRIAQEAGRPTRTGSFSEGLSNVAGGLLDEYQKEAARGAEVEQKKLDLAQKEYERSMMENKLGLLAGFGSSKGFLGQRPGQPGGAGQQQARPGIPGGQPQISGEPARRITVDDIYRLGMVDKDLGEFLNKLSETERKSLIETTEGIYNSATNSWVVKFDKKPEEYDLPIIGKKTITEKQRRAVEAIIEKNLPQDQQDRELAQYYARQGWIRSAGAPAGGAPAGGAAAAPGAGAAPEMKTPEERERAARVQGERDTAAVKDEAERVNQYTTQAAQASKIKGMSERGIALAKDPEYKKVFGLLQQPGSAFANLIAKGVRIMGNTIEVPGIEEFKLLNLKNEDGSPVTERQIAAYQSLLRDAGQFALESRALLKGSGSISNFEQEMLNRLGPNPHLNPTAYILLAEMTKLEAMFNEKRKQLYDRWAEKNPNKFARDFESSEELRKLKDDREKYAEGLYKQAFGRREARPGAPGPLESQIRR